MDQQKLAEVLRGTLDPNQRQQAEQHLEQIHKIIGFAPSLLTVIMTNELDMPVRQAGAVYLKNMVDHFWNAKKSEPNQPLPFSIHEQDRAMIRDAIIDAIIHAPDIIRVQLCVCLKEIIRSDFPGRWTNIVDKVSIYLQSPDASGWMGALMCLYQLVKCYEHKEQPMRKPLNEALKLLFPLAQQRLVSFLPDDTEQSVLLQKLILKIYFSYTSYYLCLDIVTNDVFNQWVQVIKEILQRPVPEAVNVIDEDERAELVWWKCKKWAIRLIARIFERYGSPGKVLKIYQQFANFYLKMYTGCMMEVMLGILDQQQKKIFVSPRVLQQVFNYLRDGVCHAISWKLMQPHVIGILQEVIFPIMCYTDEDEELWHADPYEYIRTKFDFFADFISHVSAAQNFLQMVAKKRKGMLQKIMITVRQVLSNEHANSRQIDGALHIVGTVAKFLLKKNEYKDQMELMIMTYVIPHFGGSHPYLKARACWMLKSFSKAEFKDDGNLQVVTDNIIKCIITNEDLPVKVEAAIALKELFNDQSKVSVMVLPKIQAIALEILKILRESEADELATVMEHIVDKYAEHLTPLAVEITEHMSTTFNQLLESDDRSEDRIVTAMGILTALESVINKFEEHPEILIKVENIIGGMLMTIFNQTLIEFYDEAFDLICSLTCEKISELMWKIFEMMYEVFQNSAFEYFLEMMPALHNFVTVDPPAFVSSENRILAIFNMCKAILTGKPGEDSECHAAKLLEVILLQFKGQIDSCVPSFIELVLERLTRQVITSELRTMCLQVVVAAIYYNPVMLFELLEKMCLPNSSETMTSHFIKQWIHDTDCFTGLHDRKICVLGLCELLTMPNRHQAITECSQQLIPSIILLFDGLKLAYVEKAQLADEDSYHPYESDEDDPGLATDEDDLGDEESEYLRRLAAKAKSKCPFPVTACIKDPENGEEQDDYFYDSDSDDDDYETPLEIYTTPLDEDDCPIDEYVIFKDTIQRIQSNDSNWYNMLTQHLNEDQRKSMNEIFILSDKRWATAESKRIEKSGGYMFQTQSVPKSFNFTSPR